MEEISLRLKYIRVSNTNSSYGREVPDLSRESIIDNIIERVNNKEDVYIKFDNKHTKRPGAIAKIKKIEHDDMYYTKKGRPSHYKFTLKWDDRKNISKIEINSEDCYYLPDYKGNTVWTMFDAKKFAKDNAKPVYDRLNQKLKIGDTVVFINARYGSGAELDFGVIQDIKYKVNETYRGKYVEPVVVIETIATREGDSVMTSKIKRSEKSIIKLTTDNDLLDTALVKKLTITQNQES